MPPNETRVSHPTGATADSSYSFSLDQTGEEPTTTLVVTPQNDAEECLGQQVSRFQLRRRLGNGSFGSVYLAFDPTLEREIALKVPRDPATWTEDNTKTFLDEARHAARIKDPHVITIYDAGSCRETGVFIAMEYVEGETLAQRLSRGKPPLADTVRWCSQVASAIHEGHKLGLVHRDLKPSNILIDRVGHAKVCDFGLALHEDLQHDRRGEVCGTRPYMSPEQVQGNSHLLDGRTDVWSLGVILYECLSGRRPFRGENWPEVREEILTRDPKPLRQIDDGIPVELDAACRHALQRSLSDRIPTALDFRKSLSGIERPPRRISMRTALGACGIVALLAAGAFLARGLDPRFGVPSAPERNVVAAGSPSLLPQRIDLLARAPEPVVVSEENIDSSYSYTAPLRLVVDSPRSAIFACESHPREMWLDVASRHGNPPGVAGALWGLHPEPAANGTTASSCLAISVRPAASKLGNARVVLHNYKIAKELDDRHAQIQSTHKLAAVTTRLDWTAPVELKFLVRDGKPQEFRIQGAIVDLPVEALSIDWSEFATGQCGLIAAQHRVVFTRALLEIPRTEQ